MALCTEASPAPSPSAWTVQGQLDPHRGPQDVKDGDGPKRRNSDVKHKDIFSKDLEQQKNAMIRYKFLLEVREGLKKYQWNFPWRGFNPFNQIIF